MKERQSSNSLLLARLDETKNDCLVLTKYLLELANRAYEIFKNSKVDQKQQLIKCALSNLQVKGGNIVYEAQKPFDMILDNTDRIGWRPLVDIFRTSNIEFKIRLARIKGIFKTLGIQLAL